MQPDLNIVPAPGRQSGLRHSTRLGLSDIYCSFPNILSQNTGRPQLHNPTVKSNRLLRVQSSLWCLSLGFLFVMQNLHPCETEGSKKVLV